MGVVPKACLCKSLCVRSLAMGMPNAAKVEKEAISLSQQLDYFKEYIQRLKLAKGESVANEIIAEALYVFSIGTNNFILNYLVLPLRRAQYTTLEYVAYLIGLADAAVRDAYHLGARKIEFTGLGPFGCIPAVRTLNLDEPGCCNKDYNQLAIRFNTELQDAVRKLNGDLVGAHVDLKRTLRKVAVAQDALRHPSSAAWESQ
ncbi:GDSL esterase/lipase [Panicum miliaceum]|uniref:GDSL esterase/lipase n=1 Tax=Panicum miliaceum TaxID=4540 RepID=A0A3L6QQL8_PANMI|nr:GDSL esterase/lipase [Panicum miliaceum]